MSFEGMKQAVIDRFLRYVRIDTQSDESVQGHPSSGKQFDLAHLLVDELHILGIENARCDGHCYVTASLPATHGADGPVIGFLAHLDTSPEVCGANVVPKVIDCYEGGDIVVSTDNHVVIRSDENEWLAKAHGHTIVTAGGATLLGADDKAGIAAIMAFVNYLIDHPEIAHYGIRIAFTPDEEIGKGVELFDRKTFGADFAYTVDGGFTGEINNETFSADAAFITITGKDMHPGYAKDRMVNSLRAMADIIARLPKNMAPETTCDREGYIHPTTVNGTVGATTIRLILRDFTEQGLHDQRLLLENIIGETAIRYPGIEVQLDIQQTYRNMFSALQEKADVLTRLERAVRKAGIEPTWKPIRGGTDGAVLTACGLPTPNIFTGGCNAHSLTEWVDIDGLAKCAEVLVHLAAVDSSVR